MPLLAALALPASAQLGPYPVVTKQATFEASLYKRDKDILWVERKSASGERTPQVGIAIADILNVQMPRPALFDAVERLRAAPKATDRQFQAAHRALDKFILQTRAMRDIPGIPANEAILLKGRLYARKGLWREAIRQFENVVTYAPGTETATNAQIYAGIAYAKSDEHYFAVEYLAGIPLPEEDEELLSTLLYALGNSYVALGNYDNALLSYLPLVVFYPYVQANEARGLAACLTCYAHLEEWEPLYRTIQEIKRLYPDSPAQETADDFLEKYHDELVKAGQFVDAAKITSSDTAP
ncbi:MAG: hypothetical protein PHO14_00200 [Kiritimatiellae bacterium]|nr:hypothetical protein [Kiritimatiellia bacterium]MDD4340634.1 hypothetical protein [Kiritimatiellia bacterium]